MRLKTTLKKAFINRLGLLGLLSLISYTAAVIFAPLADFVFCISSANIETYRETVEA